MIAIYCDGSGTHHEDSPACIGVALFDDNEVRVEVSEYVGIGTNNVAELRAVIRALWLVEACVGTETEVVIFSDSSYAIGSISQPWVLKKNVRMVEAGRARYERLPNVRFEHVKGHAGVYGNELADWLAWHARKRVLVARGKVVPERRRPEPLKGTSR